MLFNNVLGELRSAPTCESRAALATTWARRLAYVDSVEPLEILLGIEVTGSLDISQRCASVRANNVLRNNDLADLPRLVKLSLHDIQGLRNCGTQTVTEILEALLLVATEDEIGRPSAAKQTFKSVIADLRGISVVGTRDEMATAWAKRLSMAENTESLQNLLGIDSVEPLDVSSHCDTKRAANVLRFNELTELPKLIKLSVQDLWNLRNCGTQAITDILYALLITAAENGPKLDRSNSTQTGNGDDLQIVAAPVTLSGLLSFLMRELDDRQRTIVRHRLIKRDRTLDDLGHNFAVSRERVRQIEKKVIDKFSNWLKEPAVAPHIAALKEQVHSACSPLAIVDELSTALPGLSENLPDIDLQLIDFIEILLPEIHLDGRWVATSPLSDLRDETFKAAVRAGQQGHLDHEVQHLRDTLSLDDQKWSDWMNYCGLREFAGLIIRQGASQLELAVAVLRKTGHPLSTEEIAERLEVESVRSLRGRLQEDDRIARVGPNSYGLPEWQLETYEGIREEIVQRIERAGGRVLLSVVVEELVEQFGVSANSVRAYASAREFARQDGWISLAGFREMDTSSRPAGRSHSPAQTRRCFYAKELWWFRIDVGKDALRGSGFPVPRGVMTLFQVAEGTERTFSSLGKEVRISWLGIQPQFGSLRYLLEQVNAREGDTLWLAPVGENGLRARLHRKWGQEEADEIVLRSGVRRGLVGDDLRTAVAEALGLPSETAWHNLAMALRSRGDLDLAEVLEAYASSDAVRPENAVPDINDFFAALGGQ
ncbi:sigma factor-like helix-turn-helix DNA-binding protein [Streptosporangium canum]|uniref:sigma factor-like helix-turn-helix DNA-binding protein n=1 Tax=Streptosporangium canum TaxID=324952 RepID=UPI003440D71D